MANDPISDGAREFQPLGELLLSRGLITPEQLQEALAEQAQNGRPLGEIFVTRGFVSGPMIAEALATQQGRMFKSEYGYATGFDATIRGVDDEADAPPAARMSGETVVLAADARSSETGELHGRISELEEQLDSARREREEDSGRSAAELADTTAKLESRIEQLQAELAEAEQRTREQETAVLSSYHRTGVADTQQVEPQPEIERPYNLFFLAAGDGYVLIERTGTLPEVGAVLDLSDDGGPTEAVVVKIAPSPLPESTLDCAYLI